MNEGWSNAFRRLQKMVPWLNSTKNSYTYLMPKAYEGTHAIKYAHARTGEKCFAVRRLRVPTIGSCLPSFTVVVVHAAAPTWRLSARGQPKITVSTFPKQSSDRRKSNAKIK